MDSSRLLFLQVHEETTRTADRARGPMSESPAPSTPAREETPSGQQLQIREDEFQPLRAAHQAYSTGAGFASRCDILRQRFLSHDGRRLDNDK